jgi:erythromycin esterase
MRKSIPILFLAFIFNFCSYGNSGQPVSLPEYIGQRAIPLISSSNLEEVFEAAGDRKLTLLGEASHGTHEYYAWRDSISRRLIAERGYRFIAVEGDWASLYELNRFVKNMPGAATSAREVLLGIDRWPLWMWGNEEVVALAEWMREFNAALPAEKKVGFYGMDVYGEWRSKSALLDMLEDLNPALHKHVHALYACFRPFGGDSWAYARSVQRGMQSCESEFSQVVQLIQETYPDNEAINDYEKFYLLQNALVVKHAEKFYRKAMASQDASSWNSRVNYMNLTVNRLLELYGPDSKGIVWAHNTHVGDARFTEMRQFGQFNIGQLAREQHGPENVFIVGFSTYRGNVKAGSSWGSQMQNMRVPRARSNSIEYKFNQTGPDRFVMVFNEEDRQHEAFNQPMGNRAIGVVYNPARDHQQNYVLSIVPMRYDAMIFFRETRALSPLRR